MSWGSVVKHCWWREVEKRQAHEYNEQFCLRTQTACERDPRGIWCLRMCALIRVCIAAVWRADSWDTVTGLCSVLWGTMIAWTHVGAEGDALRSLSGCSLKGYGRWVGKWVCKAHLGILTSEASRTTVQSTAGGDWRRNRFLQWWSGTLQLCWRQIRLSCGMDAHENVEFGEL